MARGVRVCSQPGCGRFKPCPVPGHTPTPWEGSNRSARLPPGWHTRIRPRILARDPICYIAGCDRPSTEVDHVTPNDDHRDSNLAGICTPHHRQKSSQEGNAAHQPKDPR